MKKTQKFMIAGTVIIIAIMYLIYMGVKESGVYFMTVAELKANTRNMVGEGVRVSGSVIDGSIEDIARDLILKFSIRDEDGPESTYINVYYKGIKPDSFKSDAQVILEGKYSPDDNLLKATILLVKCPSRYEEETPPEGYKPGHPGDDKKVAGEA